MSSSGMTISAFWARAEKIFKEHRNQAGRFITSDLTGEEHYQNVMDFLSDVDSLVDDWYNRGDEKT